jgi:hypothetical protein
MPKSIRRIDIIHSLPFDDAEFFTELEEQAIDGTLNYDSFPAVEYKYFSKLSKLGYMNRHKGWSKEICEQKQKELHADYIVEKNERDFFGKIAAQMQDNIRMSGILRSEITKTSDQTQKLDLALECIGRMTGDMWFVKTNKPEVKNDNSKRTQW